MPAADEARVVDQDVDRPDVLFHLRGRLHDAVDIRDVDGVGPRLPAFAAELIDRSIEVGLGARPEDDLGAHAGEPGRQLSAKALAPAGDQYDLVSNVFQDGLPNWCQWPASIRTCTLRVLGPSNSQK